MPDYQISQAPDRVVLRNFEGVITTYKEPGEYHQDCHCSVCSGKENIQMIGVSGLLAGQQMTIEPKVLLRKEKIDEGIRYE